jgi:hypothetical protein
MHQTATHHNCKNCHNNFKGNYCNYCGEKVYSERDKKISHLFEEAFHFSTHFDNRFFRSLKKVFSKPGFLSREFCEGKRKKYYSPFSLFLVAVFLYLLFPWMQGLNISFANHLNNNRALGLNFQETWAVAKAGTEGISVEQLAAKFDHLSPKIAKVLLIVIVPLCGLAFGLIFRKKKRFFYDHFILSSEFNAFYILYIFFCLPLLFRLLSIVVPVGRVGDDNIYFILLQVFILWVVAAGAIRRFYSTSLKVAIPTAFVYLFLHSVVVFFLYRAMLFAVVMLLI